MPIRTTLLLATLLIATLATCTSLSLTPLYRTLSSRQHTITTTAAAAAAATATATPKTTTALEASRRNVLLHPILLATTTVMVSTTDTFPLHVGTGLALAATVEDGNGDASPEVTDKVYIDIKSPGDPEAKRIIIGLYGKDAPQSTLMMKQLFSTTPTGGLPAKCKPRDTTRTLQKEQLEANKVYNSCMENESRGVTYEYGQIWRIIKDYRIDVGSVSGKYIARQFPFWPDENKLPTVPGSVSVQKGNESGFGFVIHPLLSTDSDGTKDNMWTETNVAVGRVLDGLDVVRQLNESPVVTSSKVNYMSFTGSNGMKAAPSRSCAYGTGNLYCNEFKPLQKLSIVGTGVL